MGWGILAKLGAITGSFLGSKSGRESIVSGFKYIATEIDESTLTDEEKVKYHQKRINSQLKYMEMNTDQNSDRSRARRDIAKLWIRFYLGLIALTLVIRMWGKKAQYDDFKDFVVILGTGTLLILGFYFGYYGAMGIIDKIKAKK